MAKKRKHPKMEPLLVAHDEVSYIANRYKIKVSIVRAAKKKAGPSRAKIYVELRLLGYKIKTRKFPNG